VEPEARPDLVIKMNMGGGKTIVGLPVERSSLAEGASPAVYQVPDHYLADQVDSGGPSARDRGDGRRPSMDYARGRAILQP